MVTLGKKANSGRGRRRALIGVLGAAVVVVALVISVSMLQGPPVPHLRANPSAQALWTALASEELTAAEAEQPDMGNSAVAFRDASMGEGVVEPPSIEDT